MEAAVVMPFIIISVITAVLAVMFFYSQMTEQCSMHMALGAEAGRVTGKTEMLHSVSSDAELYTKKKSVIKTYSWSFFLTEARFGTETIRIRGNKFFISFSDANMAELLKFYNAFSLMKNKSHPMNKNSMKLVAIKAQNLQEIKDTEIIIKMQSSLIVRKHNSEDNTDIYYTCEDAEFPSMVKENLRVFLEKLNINMDISNFSITPLKGKKVVSKVMSRYTDQSIGIYKLTGNPELLNLLYAAGLGSRRSEAHGKFSVLF